MAEKQRLLMEIHSELVSGQRRGMVSLMEDYGLYDFFEDYKKYLEETYKLPTAFSYFADATISYFKITG